MVAIYYTSDSNANLYTRKPPVTRKFSASLGT